MLIYRSLPSRETIMAELTRRIAEKAEGNNGAPFPSQPRKFQGAYVTFTGIEKNLQENLTQIVRRLGGVPQMSVTVLTTHVIAHKLTNQTYFDALPKHIPIVKPDFIFAVRDAPGDVDVRSANFISSYSLKTFENLVVCVSKYPEVLLVKTKRLRIEIERFEARARHYFRNRKNKTDVIIIPAAIEDEFKVARGWIPTVTPDWVLSSEAEGQLEPLIEFQPWLQPLTSTQIPGASVQGPTFSGISTIQFHSLRTPYPRPRRHDNSRLKAYRRRASICLAQDVTSIHMKTTYISHILFAGFVFIVQLESESENRRISELMKANGGEILLDVGEVQAGKIAILPPLYSGRLPTGILESFTKYWVEDVCQRKCLVNFELSFHHKTIQVHKNSGKFLSGLSVLITGYSEPIKGYLGALATHLGADIQESLNVKSEPSRERIICVISNNMNDKSAEIARNSGIPIVTKDWLVACCLLNDLVDHAYFLLSSENNSVDEICSTKAATPGKPLQDSSSSGNHSTCGTTIPETPESHSLF